MSVTIRNKIATIAVAWIQLRQFLIYVILHEIINICLAIMVVPLATKKSNPTGTFFWAKICSFVITWVQF